MLSGLAARIAGAEPIDRVRASDVRSHFSQGAAIYSSAPLTAPVGQELGSNANGSYDANKEYSRGERECASERYPTCLLGPSGF